MDQNFRRIPVARNQGRMNNAERAKRIHTCEELVLKGASPRDIANLGIAHYDTILAWIKEIESEWLKRDMDWFNRARRARIKAIERYEVQLKRLNAWLNNKDLSYKEKLMVEELIRKVQRDIERIDGQMDPEQWLNQYIQEKVHNERATLVETPQAVS